MKKVRPLSVAGPLSSWDIFLNSYQQLMQKGDDLQAIKKISAKAKWKVQWDLQQELLGNDQVIVVTDIARMIVYATANVTEMNGYKPEELLGKSPKILQGKATDKKALKYISSRIAARQPFEAIIVNYRKNGQPYDCSIRAFPVFNQENELVNFIAFEKAA